MFLYSSQQTIYKLYVDDATVTVDGHLLSSVGLRSNSTLEANATLSSYAEYTTDQYHTPPYSVGLDDNGPDDAGHLYLHTIGMEDYHVYNATWYMKESQRGFYYVSALAGEGNVSYHLELDLNTGNTLTGTLFLIVYYSNSSSTVSYSQKNYITGYEMPQSRWVRFSMVRARLFIQDR